MKIRIIFMTTILVPIYSWSIDFYSVLTGHGRAFTNPGSVEAILHNSLSENTGSSCFCKNRVEDQELSKEAKERIAEKVRKTGVLVEEFKKSPIGKMLMINQN